MFCRQAWKAPRPCGLRDGHAIRCSEDPQTQWQPRLLGVASVMFPKFEEEVLRTCRDLRPLPVRAASPPFGPAPQGRSPTGRTAGGPNGARRPPARAKPPEAQPRGPLRREADFIRTDWGGEGVEKRKEAGGRRPPASLKTSPLTRPDPLTAGGLTFAGGGPPLRYGLLREGKGRGCERHRRARDYRPQAGKRRNEFLYELSKRDASCPGPGWGRSRAGSRRRQQG
jgi:hypothetical protein